MATIDGQADSTVFQALVLSVIAGCADAVAFLKFGVFAGVMTGNTVLLGIALANDDVAHALHLVLIIGCYLAGVATATLLRRAGYDLRWLLLIEGYFVLTAAALDSGRASVPLLATGMGIQSAATTRFIDSALSTVYLTGDLLKLVQGLVARLPYPARAAKGHGSTEAVVGVIWVGYLLGVLLGVAAHRVVQRRPGLNRVSDCWANVRPGGCDPPLRTDSASRRGGSHLPVLDHYLPQRNSV